MVRRDEVAQRVAHHPHFPPLFAFSPLSLCIFVTQALVAVRRGIRAVFGRTRPIAVLNTYRARNHGSYLVRAGYFGGAAEDFAPQ
jgi:hypothetical protein